MLTMRACLYLWHVAAVAGVRVDGGGVSFPPELLQQLAALTTEESLPGLLEQVPEQMRPMVQKFAPMIGKNPAMVQAIVEQMPDEQQVKIQELVDVVAQDNTLKDVTSSKELANSLQKATVQHQSKELSVNAQQEKLVGFVEGLAKKVLPTVKEHMADPGFMGKVVGAVARDGDSLKDFLGLMLGPDRAGLLDPLIKLMSVGGPSVLDSLERQASPTSQAELMDGPLRTIFLISNLLTYSTLTLTYPRLPVEGSSFGPTQQRGKRAYPVVNKHQQEQQMKWLLPEKWMQGIDLICSVLKLKLIALQLQQDELMPANGTNSATILYTVRMTLQPETGDRLIVVHNVRTTTSEDYMNDVTLLLGLYEQPIRDSLGHAKYLSLADIFYKLGQKLSRWDWLVERAHLDENNYVPYLATLDSNRKTLRTHLAEDIQATTDALQLQDTKTVHLFAGVSFGGAIAQMQGMVAKLKCPACPVVALTINSPSIYKIVKKLGLGPEDKRDKLEKMFSDSILKQQSHLFSGFVNFVAQHGTVWKLDESLPGSKVCMYMHAAEKTGCRDITNLGDLYHRAYDAFWHCRKDFVKAAEGYSWVACFKGQMSRILGCVVQEHSFLLAGGFDVKALLVSGASPNLNMTSTFTDLATIFSESSVSSRQETITSLQKETGITRTVAISQPEATQRNEMRNKIKQKAASHRIQGQAAVSARIDAQVQVAEQDWQRLPVCKGCGEEWCGVKDIREYRCCDVDKDKHCKNAPNGRSACDTSMGQTCSGVKSFVQNMGRKCKCVEGTCWNGQGCAQDASLERRKELHKKREDLPKLKQLQNQFEDYLAGEEIKEWEEQVVKMKIAKGTFVDAEPNPQFDGTWICSQ